MNKLAALAILSLLLLMAGCSGVKASSTAATVETLAPAATSTLQATVPPEPTAVPSSQPGGAASDHLGTCNLLNSQDVESFYPAAEKVGPVHTLSQVNHLIFSTENTSASEASCIYYVHYPPGQKHRQMLQVTYWLDVPDHVTPSAWAQVWSDAKSKAAQAAPGVGDDAFYEDGRLMFKQGSAYVTIEIIGTNLDTSTSAGVNQQMQMEKRIALDAESRLTQNLSSQ